eukprot:TRINITY_DN7433_c0_g1_i1.p2 TRINITY_DN7433_c0_g1~~TRINITY_DN7433_c0_g1_i1.p2  ORF type:complete len:532 (-),score=63.82 TRINITY_DN7433_c0_g1_i1:3733-5328(-)
MEDPSLSKTLKRLQNELRRAQQIGPSLKFSAALVDGNYFLWRVALDNTFGTSPIGQDLLLYSSLYGQNTIDLEIRFAQDHPLSPPAVRVVSPRFRAAGGTPLCLGGVLDSSLLTEQRWTPISTIDAIVEEMKQLISTSGARIETTAPGHYEEAEERSARNGFYRTFRCHSTSSTGSTTSLSDASLGGKVLLPASALSQIMASTDVEFPLIFEVSNATRTSATHVGVSDFTAAESSLVAPQWIVSNIRPMAPANLCTVRLVQLPKGTFLKIKPLQDEFFQLESQKEVLESVLRSFVAITTGDKLQISYEDKVWAFDVLETRPALAININNADVELDIVGSTEAVSQAVSQPASAEDALVPQLDSKPDIPVDTNSMKQCDNCLRHVPLQSLQGHIAFCIRNNMLCGKCSQVIRKADAETHEREFHSLIQCECGDNIERFKFPEHKSMMCYHRLVRCKFCKLSKRFVDLSEHQDVCGSRTDKCAKCNQIVKLKDLPLHEKSNCTYPTAAAAALRPTENESGLMGRIFSFFNQNK